ncbi:MAG: hypothetical protein WBW73_19955 [Rhodoplanes sp.]
MAVDRRKDHLEIDRPRDRRKKSGEPHEAVRLDLRQEAELRIDRGDAGQIEIVAALIGEDLAKARRRIARAEIRSRKTV